jgi:hypothetical protein
MWIFRRRLAALASATCLAGCVTQNVKTPSAPDTKTAVSAAAVVPVSAVVNQLKCDLGDFLKSQDAHPGVFTVYNITGTLTFSLERTTANGWSVAVAPSFPVTPFGPGLSGNAGRSRSTTHDVGDDVILKFDMQAQPDPSDDPHARSAIDQGACQHGLAGVGHIIEPEALRQQVEGIVLGAPKIGFSTVEYKGKFLLKQSDDPKASVSLYIISASLSPNQQDSSYTQQFDITLDLEAPVKKPPLEAEEAATAPHGVIYHTSPHRMMATPPPPGAYRPPPTESEPQVASSGVSPDQGTGGLSEHLKHLTETIPAAPPH